MINWIKTKIASAYNWIKRKIKGILIALGIIGIALAAPAFIPDKPVLPPDVSFVALERVEKIGEKFKIKVNEDPTEEMSIDIGGDMADFMPTAKLKKWGDETFVKIKYPTVKKIKPVQKDGKLKWKDKDMEVHFETTEDAFKFIPVLKKKPKTNVIELEIESEGLEFYYQPELTQEKIDGGAFRPEHIVGSWAVYHESKTNHILYPIDKNEYTQEELNQMVLDKTHIGKSNEKTGKVDYLKLGKNYRAGKFGHIYRPRLKDSNGWEVWGDLFIDAENGIYRIIIPTDFYENANYPIKSNDTFGYYNGGTQGGTSDAKADDQQRGSRPIPSSTEGTLDSITAYVQARDGITDASFGLYLDSDNSKVDITEEFSLTLSADWYTANASAGNSFSNADHILIVYTESHNYNWWWDTASGYYIATDSNTYNYPTSWIDPMTWITKTGDTGERYSIYATYTAGGAEEEPAERRFFIFD